MPKSSLEEEFRAAFFIQEIMTKNRKRKVKGWVDKKEAVSGVSAK